MNNPMKSCKMLFLALFAAFATGFLSNALTRASSVGIYVDGDECSPVEEPEPGPGPGPGDSMPMKL